MSQSPLSLRPLSTLIFDGRRLLATLVVLLATMTGCTYDSQTLEDTRCINNEACWEVLGDDWFCRDQSGDQGGYCVKLGPRVCSRVEEGEVSGDAACDDNIYCNGDEVCDPGNEASDDFGCINLPREMDDNIACTQDYCDEEQDLIVHDPASDCECIGPGDGSCSVLYTGPCVISASCNPNTYTCDVAFADAGNTCISPVECVTNAICDSEHNCNPAEGSEVANNNVCSDGDACTGEETCQPDSDQADPRGCVAGTLAIDDPSMDDGVACTRTSCEDSVVSHIPTETCECQTPEDCRTLNPEMACATFICDASNGFTCQVDEAAPALADDTPCDDGVACTANDVCAAGVCTGVPTHLFCAQDGSSTCNPTGQGVDERGCTVNN